MVRLHVFYPQTQFAPCKHVRACERAFGYACVRANVHLSMLACGSAFAEICVCLRACGSAFAEMYAPARLCVGMRVRMRMCACAGVCGAALQQPLCDTLLM